MENARTIVLRHPKKVTICPSIQTAEGLLRLQGEPLEAWEEDQSGEVMMEFRWDGEQLLACRGESKQQATSDLIKKVVVPTLK